MTGRGKAVAGWRLRRLVVAAGCATAAAIASIGGSGCSAPAPSGAAPSGARQATAPPRFGVAAASASLGEAAAAAAALQRWYNGRAYRTAKWWQSAIALSVVTSYMEVTGSRAYLADLADTYRAFAGTNDFTRRYYDDEGWWALAWVQAYGLTRDSRYLAEAEHIFSDMTTGWSGVCGGGLTWGKSSSYKNSITNELFLDVAASLHNAVGPGDRAYARWALREWRWFRSSGLITSSHLVVDGLSACRPALGSPTWTYNQGVLIGGLVQLSSIVRPAAPLAEAGKVADAVIASPALSPHGILTEPCQPASCDRDSTIFKGVFAQNLGLLEARAPQRAYVAYLRRNARSLWQNDRRGGEFGLSWTGPFDKAGSARQVAGLAVLTARIAASQA